MARGLARKQLAKVCESRSCHAGTAVDDTLDGLDLLLTPGVARRIAAGLPSQLEHADQSLETRAVGHGIVDLGEDLAVVVEDLDARARGHVVEAARALIARVLGVEIVAGIEAVLG